MAHPETPLPVKCFVAVLYRESARRIEAEAELTSRWGPLDFTGRDHPFDVTPYYEPEMGAMLLRRLIAFERLYSPELVVEMKLQCNVIEDNLAKEGKRTVNLDAGYLDHNKYLLASAKEAGQKIYLGKGIYADLAGRYRGGKYQPFEWSFPDFRDGRYDGELIGMRKLYLSQVKEYRARRNGEP